MHFLPRIVMDIRRVGRTQTRVAAVADTRQRTVFHQVRYVAPVADMYLVVGFGYGGIVVGGVLQFDDTHGNTVHKQQHIGYPHIATAIITHHILIDAAEHIAFGVHKVDIPHKQVLVCVIAMKTIPVAIEAHHTAQSVIQCVATGVAQVGYDTVCLIVAQCLLGIPPLQITAQVIFYQGFRQLTVGHLAAVRSSPTIVCQQLHHALFVFALV